MTTKPLRLAAQSVSDLETVSAIVQDAVVKAENLKFEAKARRFGLEINRYRWEAPGSKRTQERVRSLLAFEGVLSVKTRAISKSDPELILSLLSVTFKPDAEPPGGVITLLFAGDGELSLCVEMLEAVLMDSDYVWPTRHRPDHERRKR